MSLERADIEAALRTVIEPWSKRDVLSAGLVQGLVIRDRHVGFTIEVDPARGAEAEPLRRACEEAVAKLSGVLSVTAVLTAHRQPPGGAPPAAARRGHAHEPAAAGGRLALDGIGAVIAVASGKGGVGKSTIAVNLAVALAKLGKRVGLLDADIYGPSVPRLLGLSQKPESDGKKIAPIEVAGLKAMSIGLLVGEDTPMIWRGPMIQSALTQLVGDVAWQPLDVLVIDMPPGTGDAQLTLAQRVPLAGAVIVSTPQDLALIDARKAIAMFEKTRVPILGVVENMSTFICPHCGGETQLFGHGGARETAGRLGVPFLGEVPLQLAIRETSDAGTPITAQRPDGAEAKAFFSVAEGVVRGLERSTKAPPRIVVQ